jgi:hypothetical protein
MTSPLMLFLLIITLPTTHSQLQHEDEHSAAQVLDKGLLWSHTFRPPFDDEDEKHGGKALEGWAVGGSAKVFNTFIRLTPDKPSKTGWIFNTSPAESGDWTAIFRFRISGKSEKLSGDGMAFWFTDTQSFRPGRIFGSTDIFRGIGIVFDTFVNDHSHKDVMVVVGNGVDPVSLTDGQFPGCESQFRRWEGDNKFTPEQESAAKVTLSGTTVTVQVDPTGLGKFTKCIEVDVASWLKSPDDGLSNRRGGRGAAAAAAAANSPEMWKSRAHFFFTSATGALSDNHDILEIIVTRPGDIHKVLIAADEELSAPVAQIDTNVPHVDPKAIAEHVNDVAYSLKDTDDKLRKMQTLFEHKLESLQQHVDNILADLKKQEKAVESRVDELERQQTTKFMNKIETRVKEMEINMKHMMDVSQSHLETKITRDVGSSWKIPFIIFVIIVLASFGWVMFRVRKIDARDKRLM